MPVSAQDGSLRPSKEDRPRVVGNMERLIAKYENRGDARRAASLSWARRELNDNHNFLPFIHLRQLDTSKPFPVTIDEFLEDPQFLGYLKGDFAVWDAHIDRVRRMNPDVICGEDPVTEVALGGASGTGKTTLAWIKLAYDFYLLTCFKNAQKLFGLAPVTPIVFTMQSLSQAITKLVIYRPFRTMITSMPYIQKHCAWDKQKDGQLDFENDLYIIPALARGTSLQGQAVIGGILDELAFMSVIESSKQVSGPRGEGGKFDQAEEVFNETINRRNRSFTYRGVSIGGVCAMSNTHYRGDFMDRHMVHIETTTPRFTVSERLRRYEVAPDDIRDVQAGDTVSVLIGTDYYPTRVIGEGDEDAPGGGEVIEVPKKYEGQFLLDPDKALREIVGIASAAIKPFIRRRDKLVDMFNRGVSLGLKSYVDVQDVDLSIQEMPQWVDDQVPEDKNLPRFVHIDLSKSKDRCGIAIVKPFGFMNVPDPDAPGTVRTVPSFAVECAVTLRPSGQTHIEPADIRTWLMKLSTVYDLQIGGVSYDGYQSQESLQMWRRAGVSATEVSMDRSTEAYDYLRQTIYEDRISSCPSEILMEELIMLEYNEETDKIDHPPKGSKDLSDAVAGAVFNASRQRSFRTAVGYYDEEGQKVRVKDRSGRRSAPRPTSGRRKQRAEKAAERGARLPQQEQKDTTIKDTSGLDEMEPPKDWSDKHGTI